MKTIDNGRVSALMARERERFTETHPRSRALHQQARHSLLSGVPMNWFIRTQSVHSALDTVCLA